MADIFSKHNTINLIKHLANIKLRKTQRKQHHGTIKLLEKVIQGKSLKYVGKKACREKKITYRETE